MISEYYWLQFFSLIFFLFFKIIYRKAEQNIALSFSFIHIFIKNPHVCGVKWQYSSVLIEGIEEKSGFNPEPSPFLSFLLSVTQLIYGLFFPPQWTWLKATTWEPSATTLRLTGWSSMKPDANCCSGTKSWGWEWNLSASRGLKGWKQWDEDLQAVN